MTMTRSSERRKAVRKGAAIGFVFSVLGHMLLLAILAPIWMEKLAEEPPLEPDSEAELEVHAVYEEVPQEEPLVRPLEPEVVELQPEIDDASDKQGMMVAAREVPRAEVVEPLPEPPPAPSAVVNEAPIEEQSPVILKRPKVAARQLLIPSAVAYEEVFAHSDEHARERAREHARGKVLFRDYEETSARIRESLQSFGHVVKPGNHTGVHPHSGAFGSYIGVIHRKIHLRWANGYLMDLDLHEPVGSAMNNPTLNTKLEFVIRAEDGELEAVNIVESSGQVRFDAQAIAIAHQVGPHPNPPEELVSPDGRIYVHWNFWRDQRQCGTFGASIYMVSEQGGAPG